MIFYELTHPDYLSDRAYTRHNPVQLLDNERVPSINCEDCGIWSGSERIRKKVNLTPKAMRIIAQKFVPASNWKEIINDLAFELGVSYDLLRPGAELGSPKGLVVSTVVNDFIHPFPGIIWIKRTVMDALQDAKVTGVDFSPVELYNKKIKERKSKPDDLWELVVNGKAWRKGSCLEAIRECKKCTRKSFPDPEYLDVDETTWDGSDFLILDLNPNIVIVTEKVQRILGQVGFTNYLCKKTDG